jgi:glycine cleavage system aminomethyltransferase T
MQRTPIHEAEREAHAAFGEVEGWEMPKVFAGVKGEYLAGKGAVGVTDGSHFGRLRVSGARRLDLLHRITTNHVEDLKPGQGARTILCTGKGRIIDDLLLYADDDHGILVTSPNKAAAVREAIEKARSRDDVTLEDLTTSTAMIALVGPESARLVERVAGSSMTELPLHHWRRVLIDGVPVMAARSHRIGEGGFNLIMEAGHGNAVWKWLLREGASCGVAPVGAEAVEILRVESGVPANGRELTEEFHPLEARLDAAVRRDESRCTGEEVGERPGARREVQRLLVGFLMDEGAVPELRSRVYVASEEVGVITSVAPSFEMGRVIALGYVRAAHEAPGTRVQIRSAGGAIGAEIAALPFGSAPLSSSGG